MHGFVYFGQTVLTGYTLDRPYLLGEREVSASPRSDCLEEVMRCFGSSRCLLLHRWKRVEAASSTSALSLLPWRERNKLWKTLSICQPRMTTHSHRRTAYPTHPNELPHWSVPFRVAWPSVCLKYSVRRAELNTLTLTFSDNLYSPYKWVQYSSDSEINNIFLKTPNETNRTAAVVELT